MSKRIIEIIIAPGGGISIDAVGFKGADCEQATKFLEDALGKTTQKRFKPEYRSHTKQRHKQRLGS